MFEPTSEGGTGALPQRGDRLAGPRRACEQERQDKRQEQGGSTTAAGGCRVLHDVGEPVRGRRRWSARDGRRSGGPPRRRRLALRTGLREGRGRNGRRGDQWCECRRRRPVRCRGGVVASCRSGVLARSWFEGRRGVDGGG